MLAHAIRWSNGLVMAFDEKGRAMTTLEGVYGDVKEKVLHEATASTVFQYGDWNSRRLTTVAQEEW